MAKAKLILNNMGMSAGGVRSYLKNMPSPNRQNGVFIDSDGEEMKIPKGSNIVQEITNQANQNGQMAKTLNLAPHAPAALGTTVANIDYFQLKEKDFYLYTKKNLGWKANIRDTDNRNGEAKEWDAMVLSFDDDVSAADALAASEIVKQALRETTAYDADILEAQRDALKNGTQPDQKRITNAQNGVGRDGLRPMFASEQHDNTDHQHYHYVVQRYAADLSKTPPSVSKGNDLTKQGEVDVLHEKVVARLKAANLGHIDFSIDNRQSQTQNIKTLVTPQIQQTVNANILAAGGIAPVQPGQIVQPGQPVPGTEPIVSGNMDVQTLQAGLARDIKAYQEFQAKMENESRQKADEIAARQRAVEALLKQDQLQSLADEAVHKAENLDAQIATTGAFAESVLAKAKGANVPDTVPVPEALKDLPEEVAQSLVKTDLVVTQLNAVKQGIDEAFEDVELPQELRERLADPVGARIDAVLREAVEVEVKRARAAGEDLEAISPTIDAINLQRGDLINEKSADSEFVTEVYWDAYNDYVIHNEKRRVETVEQLKEAAVALDAKEAELQQVKDAEAAKAKAIFDAIAKVDPKMAAAMQDDLAELVKQHTEKTVRDLSLAKTAVAATGVQLKSATKQLDSANKQLDAVRKDNDIIRNERDQAKQELMELREKVQKLEQAATEKRAEVESYRKAQETIANMASNTLGKTYKSEEAERAVLDMVTNKIPELGQKAALAQGEVKSLNERVTELRQQLEKAEQQRKDDMEKLRNEMDTQRVAAVKEAVEQIQRQTGQQAAPGQQATPGGFAATPETPAAGTSTPGKYQSGVGTTDAPKPFNPNQSNDPNKKS